MSVAILSISVRYSFDQGEKQSERTHSYIPRIMYGCMISFDATIDCCVSVTEKKRRYN